MQVRFRKLSHRFDPSTYAETVASNRADGDSADLAPLLALASAPRQVTAREGSGSVEQVRVLLQCGELQLTDLVDVGEGWQTFDDCLLFDAESESLRRRASLRRRMLLLALLAGGSLLAALLFFAAPYLELALLG